MSVIEFSHALANHHFRSPPREYIRVARLPRQNVKRDFRSDGRTVTTSAKETTTMTRWGCAAWFPRCSTIRTVPTRDAPGDRAPPSEDQPGLLPIPPSLSLLINARVGHFPSTPFAQGSIVSTAPLFEFFHAKKKKKTKGLKFFFPPNEITARNLDCAGENAEVIVSFSRNARNRRCRGDDTATLTAGQNTARRVQLLSYKTPASTFRYCIVRKLVWEKEK